MLVAVMLMVSTNGTADTAAKLNDKSVSSSFWALMYTLGKVELGNSKGLNLLARAHEGEGAS